MRFHFEGEIIAETVSDSFYKSTLTNAPFVLARLDYTIWRTFHRQTIPDRENVISIFIFVLKSVYQTKPGRSKVNPHHLVVVEALAQCHINAGASDKQITIRTLHRGQRASFFWLPSNIVQYCIMTVSTLLRDRLFFFSSSSISLIYLS